MPGVSPGAMSQFFRARSPGRHFRIRPADLLLTSAVSAISLSSFQLVPSDSISPSCLVAYNTPLQGCTGEDFTDGTCSASCMRTIERITRNIQSACESVEPATNSLLDLAMSGLLLEVICPRNGDNDDDNATEATTTTKVPSTNPTADGPTSVQDTTKTQTTCHSSSLPSSTTAADDGDVATVTSTLAPAEPTEEDLDPLARGGGGSPFDPIQFSGAAGLPGQGWMKPWSLIFAVVTVAAFSI